MAEQRQVSSVSGTVRTLVLATVLIAVLAIALLWRGKPSDPKVQPVATLNQPAVRFVSFVVVDDIQAGLAGEDSLIAKIPGENPLDWAEIDRKVTAKEYETAYDDNEIAADNKFKGKKILLSGTIAAIEKDFTGSGYLTLIGSDPLPGVQAQLTDSTLAAAASFKRGQKIDLVCRGVGRITAIAILDNCQPLGDYMKGTTPSIESRVTAFLEGRLAQGRATANMITSLYVTGLSLPSSSPCLNGKRESCKSELGVIFKDAANRKAMQDQANQMLASLKIMGK